MSSRIGVLSSGIAAGTGAYLALAGRSRSRVLGLPRQGIQGGLLGNQQDLDGDRSVIVLIVFSRTREIF